METGLHFMMERKKIKLTYNSIDYNNLEDCQLSIQLSLDGFSFCILNNDLKEIIAISHESFSDSSPTPEKHLENISNLFQTEELLQKKYQSINVTHVNELSTLVPKPLFDAENLKQYIKYSSKIYKNDYIVFDAIENHDMINVYVPFVHINNFLLDKFGGFEYKHSSSVLVENLLNTYKYSERPHLFVNIFERHMEMVAISDNKLIFYNSFKFETKEDFIYYILFTAEQLEFNPDKFELLFSGLINKESELFQIAYTYVRNVSLLENRSKYSFGPQFTDEIKRNYFTLLNQY